jgi:phosphoglucosamine mutase
LAGLVSTPTLAFISRHFDAGIMITASHNPANYNGIKLWNPDGMAFDTEQMMELEKTIFEEKFSKTSWNQIPPLDRYPNAVDEHMDAIINKFETIKLKIAVDCAAGAGATITPYVLRKLGCEVIALNAQLDGYFPGRKPEPSTDTLHELTDTVQAIKADCGIAHDGDADRTVIVNERGTLIPTDRMLALMGKQVAKTKMVVPVDASCAIDDYLQHIEIRRTRVGDVFVAEEMKACHAEFGGEPSGTWIFPSFSYCPDGIYAAAAVASLLYQAKTEELTLGDLLKDIPQYRITRGHIECKNKKQTMENIIKAIGHWGTISTVDGIRVDMEEGWILVRPSGTEPLIRITVESRSDTKNLYSKVRSLVTKMVK